MRISYQHQAVRTDNDSIQLNNVWVVHRAHVGSFLQKLSHLCLQFVFSKAFHGHWKLQTTQHYNMILLLPHYYMYNIPIKSCSTQRICASLDFDI